MANQEDMQFGRNAVSLGLIKSDQLALCLRLQEEFVQKKGEYHPLSEWMVAQGYLQHSQVDRVRQRCVQNLASQSPPTQRKTEALAQFSKTSVRIEAPIDSKTGAFQKADNQTRISVPMDAQARGIVPTDNQTRESVSRDSQAKGISMDTQARGSAFRDSQTKGISIDKNIPIDTHSKETTSALVAPSHNQPIPASGYQFGRYTLLEEIGRGGMGRVYKAQDPKLRRIVALKMLINEDNETDVLRFVREAKATAQLRHTNIITVYDIGEEKNQHYFTMDFVEGISLDRLIKQSTLTVRQAVEIMIKVGGAIHYAHTQGIIHRDLKPANVMLDSANEPRVMDFGLAKMVNESKKLSQSGTIVGTLQYMPPEQVEGRSHTIGPQSDVYALGAMLYEMLTGRPPFVGSSFSHLIEQILKKKAIPPSEIRKTAPKEMDNVCLKCLEKKKEDRYESAQALVDDLQRFLANKPVEAKISGAWRNVVILQRLDFLLQRLGWRWAGLLASVLFFLIGGIIGYYCASATSKQPSEQAVPRPLDDIMNELSQKNLTKENRIQYASQIVLCQEPGTAKKLLKYLSSSNPNHRIVAAEALGRWRDPQAKLYEKFQGKNMEEWLQDAWDSLQNKGIQSPKNVQEGAQNPDYSVEGEVLGRTMAQFKREKAQASYDQGEQEFLKNDLEKASAHFSEAVNLLTDAGKRAIEGIQYRAAISAQKLAASKGVENEKPADDKSAKQIFSIAAKSGHPVVTGKCRLIAGKVVIPPWSKRGGFWQVGHSHVLPLTIAFDFEDEKDVPDFVHLKIRHVGSGRKGEYSLARIQINGNTIVESYVAPVDYVHIDNTPDMFCIPYPYLKVKNNMLELSCTSPYIWWVHNIEVEK